MSVDLAVATHMWLHWTRVAIERAGCARSARAALAKAQESGDPLEMGNELQPALVAVAASAHALDALYDELKPLVVPEELARSWKQGRLRRHSQIHETLKLGFRISAHRWQDHLQWLFELRNAAVHPMFAFSDAYAATPKHSLGLNAAREYHVFTVEAAERALGIVLDIAKTCVDAPKPEAAKWAADMQASVQALVSEADQALGGDKQET